MESSRESTIANLYHILSWLKRSCKVDKIWGGYFLFFFSIIGNIVLSISIVSGRSTIRILQGINDFFFSQKRIVLFLVNRVWGDSLSIYKNLLVIQIVGSHKEQRYRLFFRGGDMIFCPKADDIIIKGVLIIFDDFRNDFLMGYAAIIGKNKTSMRSPISIWFCHIGFTYPRASKQ